MKTGKNFRPVLQRYLCEPIQNTYVGCIACVNEVIFDTLSIKIIKKVYVVPFVLRR